MILILKNNINYKNYYFGTRLIIFQRNNLLVNKKNIKEIRYRDKQKTIYYIFFHFIVIHKVIYLFTKYILYLKYNQILYYFICIYKYTSNLE